MTAAFHTTSIVLPGNKIEISAPEFQEGTPVRIVVISDEPARDEPTSPRSALDIIHALKGHRIFQSAEEVDRHINEERDSWDR